jgi:translation initiation factor IF-3
LIDEAGRSLGVVSRDQALYLAYEMEYDLVLLNDRADPPLARLMDYGKFQYMQQKQDSKQKAKSKTSELKEIRMGIKIDQHDLAVKIEKIKKFLDKGDQVKITIILKGREMMFRDKVEVLIDKIKNESQAILEKPLEKLGNRFSVILRK